MTLIYNVVLIINSKSKLPRGQLAILGGQATIKSYAQSSQLERTKYFLNGQMKVTLKAHDDEHLTQLQNEAEKMNLNCSAIKWDTDESFAVLAIGPNSVTMIDSITGSLKLA